MAEIQFVFKPDGRLYREDITRREIQVTREILQSVSADVSLRAKGVAQHERWGQFNLCVDSTSCWWTAHLPFLTLRCPWIMKDGKWVPELTSNESVSELKWVPPDTMRLAFLVATRWDSSRNQAYKEGHSYLFAYASDGTTYRLPLGNLYDECRICLGTERFVAPTHLQCVSAVLEQFGNSNWNADLWRAQDHTQRLFAYTPRNEGFDQIFKTGNWAALCSQVGNTVSEKVTL